VDTSFSAGGEIEGRDCEYASLKNSKYFIASFGINEKIKINK